MTTDKTDLHWVYQSIINWSRLPEKYKEIPAALQNGCQFSFMISTKATSKWIHAYAGYYNDQVFFHLVQDTLDKQENYTKENIPIYLVSVRVYGNLYPLGSANCQIDRKDALRRISNWNNKELSAQWYQEAIRSGEFYQAFAVPLEDLEKNTPHSAWMALKEETDFKTKESKYKADLVLSCKNDQASDKNLIFYDTCRPVPPFKPKIIDQEDFGLLNFIGSL